MEPPRGLTSHGLRRTQEPQNPRTEEPQNLRTLARLPGPRYVVLVRASSRILLARAGLKTPHEQKRVSTAAASSGVRRFSLTKSIIFFASEWLIMPCPHIVESIITCPDGILSVLPSKPSE